jgi:hypothetical protein
LLIHINANIMLKHNALIPHIQKAD